MRKWWLVVFVVIAALLLWLPEPHVISRLP